MKNLPTVVISACITGEECRYNGESCISQQLLDRTSGKVNLLPVCPEHQSGMGTPREPMDLYIKDGHLRLITVDTGIDKTDQLKSWIAGISRVLDQTGVAGFILKSGSPSCGIASARLHQKGKLQRNGSGLFAMFIRQHFPGIPAAEERDLDSIERINSFIDSIIALNKPTGGRMC